jgi:hypothetical protein
MNSHIISGYTVTAGPNNGRTYQSETLKKAIKEYKQKLKKLERKHKLEKISKINGERN